MKGKQIELDRGAKTTTKKLRTEKGQSRIKEYVTRKTTSRGIWTNMVSGIEIV